MTIEEAIKHCEEVADTPCFTDEEARCYSEHRQLAEWLKELKAYKEQSGDEELDFVPEHKKIPCTLIIGKSCEDVISRQAVFDLPRQTIRNHLGGVVGDVVYVEDIKRLPSVSPQPKVGRWKFTVYDANRIGHYECSECHWNVLMNVSDYCPHCGAKMEVG